MNCPNCGAQLQEGTLVCPNCAAALPVDNASQPAFNQAPVYDVPKKSKKGLIIGLSCAAVVVIAAVILCVVLLIGGGKNGTYLCKDMEAYGVTCTIKVDGSKFTMKMAAFGENETQKGTIKFNGKKVKLTAEGETIEGTYNKSKKTITFEGMTFTKK